MQVMCHCNRRAFAALFIHFRGMGATTSCTACCRDVNKKEYLVHSVGEERFASSWHVVGIAVEPRHALSRGLARLGSGLTGCTGAFDFRCKARHRHDLKVSSQDVTELSKSNQRAYLIWCGLPIRYLRELWCLLCSGLLVSCHVVHRHAQVHMRHTRSVCLLQRLGAKQGVHAARFAW